MSLPEAQLCSNEPWDFRQIPGCVLWLSSSSVEVVGGNVRTLYDKSGGGYDAVQTTVARQAVYVSASQNFNLRPTINFNTKLKFYQSTIPLATIPFRNDPFTLIWVANRALVPEGDSDDFIFSVYGSPGDPHIVTGTSFDGYMKNFYGVSQQQPFYHFPAARPYIYMLSFTPIRISYWRSGVMSSTSPHLDESFTSRAVGSYFRVGTDFEGITPGPFDDGYNGELSDIAMWNRDLDLNEKARLVQEISSYYNLPEACP
jgi:hypothetical protein